MSSGPAAGELEIRGAPDDGDCPEDDRAGNLDGQMSAIRCNQTPTVASLLASAAKVQQKLRESARSISDAKVILAEQDRQILQTWQGSAVSASPPQHDLGQADTCVKKLLCTDEAHEIIQIDPVMFSQTAEATCPEEVGCGGW